MTLNRAELSAHLGQRLFRFYPSVESTNDLAMEWLRSGAPAGAVVIADEQRAGRGRQGRRWYTPPGTALAVSVILRPPAAAAARISLLGALAVAQTCETLGVQRVGIKWPNDVQIDGKKVCGILPEAAWDQRRLVGVVLGIGVNIRVDFTGGELEAVATSVEPALGRPVNRAEFATRLLHCIDGWQGYMQDPALLGAWKQRLTTLGQRVSVGEIIGTAIDVDEGGALLVRTESGQVERVVAGDLTLGSSAS